MITFIVATSGRPTLQATLKSIETLPGDEVLVVGNVDGMTDYGQFRFLPRPPGEDWGHTERNWATPLARGRYISHMDDDDVYAPGVRAAMADAIQQTSGRPIVFRMQYKNGTVLWSDHELRCGNIGTPMVLWPNALDKLGTWGPFYGGDFHFIETSKWVPEDYVWRSEIIALLRPHT